jgi:hypothetical protein
MWLMSETGFVSAVTHWDNPEIIVVRARDYESLTGIADFAEQVVKHTPDNDYPIRVEVPREVFAEYVTGQIMSMTYSNYKDRMYSTRGRDFTHALSDVWSTMHQVETARYPEQEEEKKSVAKQLDAMYFDA